MPLILDAIPGLVDLPDSALAAGGVCADHLLTKINQNAKFGCVRPEFFYGEFVDGDTVPMPQSEADGYIYSPSEIQFGWSLRTGYQQVSGRPSAKGQELLEATSVSTDPADFGKVSILRVYYVQGGQQTNTNDGVLAVFIIATRGAGKVSMLTQPQWFDLPDSAWGQDSPVTDSNLVALSNNARRSVVSSEVFLMHPTGVQGAGAIISLLLNQGGLNYQVGDVINILDPDGSGAGAQAQVATVGSAGNILTFTLVANGQGYGTGQGFPTSGGHGTGATIDITALDNSAFSNGQQVPLPRSPVDNYAYSRQEVKYFPFWTYTGNPNRTGPSGPGRVRVKSLLIDQATGIVTTSVHYWDGHTDTPTTDGLVYVLALCTRAFATTALTPTFVDSDDSDFWALKKLGDLFIQEVNENARFANMRPEFFVGLYTDGQQIPNPVSPIDGYAYQSQELQYLFSMKNTGSVPDGDILSEQMGVTLGGQAQNVAVNAPGTGYTPGDVLAVIDQIGPPGSGGALVVVDTVDAVTGAITSTRLVQTGTGYQPGNGLASAGGTGAGASFNLTAVGGPGTVTASVDLQTTDGNYLQTSGAILFVVIVARRAHQTADIVIAQGGTPLQVAAPAPPVWQAFKGGNGALYFALGPGATYGSPLIYQVEIATDAAFTQNTQYFLLGSATSKSVVVPNFFGYARAQCKFLDSPWSAWAVDGGGSPIAVFSGETSDQVTDYIIHAGTCPAGGGAQASFRRIFVAGPYTVLATDILVFDEFIDAASVDSKYGLDFEYGAAGTGSRARNSTLVDENGLSISPATDLSNFCFGEWYHRSFALAALAGQEIGSFASAWFGNTPGLHRGRLANIKIVNGVTGNTNLIIYSSGGIASTPVWSAGPAETYTGVTVTTLEQPVLAAQTTGQHLQGGISIGQLEDPYVKSVAAGGGGTIPAGTYQICISSFDGTGETWVNAPTPVVVGANGSVTINWDPIPGAAGYRIYFGVDLAHAYYQTTLFGEGQSSYTLLSIFNSGGALAPLTNASGGTTYAGIVVTGYKTGGAPGSYFLALGVGPNCPAIFSFSDATGINAIFQTKNTGGPAYTGSFPELDIAFSGGSIQLIVPDSDSTKELDVFLGNVLVHSFRKAIEYCYQNVDIVHQDIATVISLGGSENSPVLQFSSVKVGVEYDVKLLANQSGQFEMDINASEAMTVDYTGKAIFGGNLTLDAAGGVLSYSGGTIFKFSNAPGLGFYGTAAQAKPTWTGSKAGNAALASLLSSLATLGLGTDNTT